MRYLVVLDANSSVGDIFLKGACDGVAKGGNDVKHPVIRCEKISTESYYLYVKRFLSEENETFQEMYIPHSSVVSIHMYDKGDKPPFGFGAASD